MTENKQKWFESWFDTNYYHLLYKHRNQDEANSFINRLFSYLEIQKEHTILDVACGRGRYSTAINQLGFNVTGIDLSSNNINFAKQFENKNLRFIRHDMCVPMHTKFDVVLNLFTSIGYFNEATKNLEAIQCFWENLNLNGVGVIDFMNVEHAVKHLVEKEVKKVEEISFHITRTFNGTHFLKEICFEDNNQHFHFIEKVHGLRLVHFLDYFKSIGISNYKIFGNYQLEPFQPEISERLILIFYK